MVTDKGRSARESSIASGWTVEGQQAESPIEVAPENSSGDPRSENDTQSAARAQLSNSALVLLGLLGGIYLLFTIVWFSWANAKAFENSLVADGSGSIGGVLQQVVFWIAPFAPVLWFTSVLVLCREAKLGKKVLWLVVGAIVLVPLPMLGGLF